MRMVCIECGEPIRPKEEFVRLAGKAVIHQDCAESILDKPAKTEDGRRPGTKTSETVSKEWML